MKLQKTLLNGLYALVAGIVFSAAGSYLFKNNYYYTTLNYVGFGVQSAGTILLVLGAFWLVEGVFKTILARERRTPRWLPPRFIEVPQQKLFQNLHIFAAGVAVALVGSAANANWAKFTVENYLGYGLTMFGLAAAVVGTVGLITTYVVGSKHGFSMLNKILAVTAGVAMFLLGSVTAGEWATQTVANYVGFAVMLAGVFVISFGVFAVVSIVVKEYVVKLKSAKPLLLQEKWLFRSLWVIAFAVGVSIAGLDIANVWATVSIENYLGYGMLLLGIATLLLGHGGIAAAFATPRLALSRARRALIEMLEASDLDAVGDPAAKDFVAETEKKMLQVLSEKDEVPLVDLASNLGLSLGLTKKFLLHGMRRNSVVGYLTLDGEKFFSKNGLRKNIEALLAK